MMMAYDGTSGTSDGDGDDDEDGNDGESDSGHGEERRFWMMLQLAVVAMVIGMMTTTVDRVIKPQRSDRACGWCGFCRPPRMFVCTVRGKP